MLLPLLLWFADNFLLCRQKLIHAHVGVFIGTFSRGFFFYGFSAFGSQVPVISHPQQEGKQCDERPTQTYQYYRKKLPTYQPTPPQKVQPFTRHLGPSEKQKKGPVSRNAYSKIAE